MPPLPPLTTHRIITYYQTHHDRDGKPISVLPLVTQPHIGITHVILAAIHLNDDPNAITLNDHPPHHPRFATLWAELRILQASGIRVLGMLGGAAKGSYAKLDGDEPTFERYYSPLRDLVRARALDGLDLDVEEETSLAGIIRLVDRLRADFGPSFLITLAPVAAALLDPRRNLSGFDYEALEVIRGAQIAWYNAQFYCGWGDCSSPVMYEMVLARGWDPAKVVVGLVTNPENGSGWVPWEGLAGVIPLLAGRHPRFGGVMGWEYFNGLPGGRDRPWEWAQWMTALVKGARTGSHHLPTSSDNVVVPVGKVEDDKPVEDSNGREADPDDDKGGEAPVPGTFEYYTEDEGDES
ncbi:Chitinase [Pleurostoma richardsiae]|uniref:chitinase n=1 Tax=Pleurostoma richardsiae TaxID=41990 RepID=A0AA38RG81_9PEZI|nr:Chitinase [Pleurostoma richardsiae]